MITLTMEQVINFRNADSFFNDTTLPLKAAYKINKIRKALDKESEFYTEKFQEIVNKYAKKDENGNVVFSEGEDQIMIKEDLIEECNKALADLQNLEVQIESYNLKIEDLGENIQCTPDELEALMPFMEE